MLETPPRKRPLSATPLSSPSSSAPRQHANKRFRRDQRPSPSPRTVSFEAARPADNDDHIAESDIPESPIPDKRTSSELLSPLVTPLQEIDVPFEGLNIKSSVPKKSALATPVRGKVLGGDTSRSVKKSAKKTPGSAKANKPQPFRIKVFERTYVDVLTYMQSSGTSMIDHPLTVIPVASFPRAFLPISWLSGSTPKIFSTHSPENLTRAIGSGVVMVAKVEGEKSMVIMERVDDRVYSMCSLRKDLKIKDVRYIAKASRDNDVKLEVKALNAAAMPVDGSEWWTSMAVQTLPSDFSRHISLKFLHGETPSIQFAPLPSEKWLILGSPNKWQ